LELGRQWQAGLVLGGPRAGLEVKVRRKLIASARDRTPDIPAPSLLGKMITLSLMENAC